MEAPAVPQLIFRMATREDAPTIVALLNDTFRTPIDEATWNWYVYGNPHGSSRVYVGLEPDRTTIAGVIAFSPIPLRLNGVTVEGDYAHHLALKPAYRETLSYVALNRHSLEGEAAAGVKIAIGPPNRRAYPIHRTLMRWVDFGYLDCLRKVSPAPAPHSCRVLTSFPDGFNQLYAQVSRDMEFCVEKTAAWMNWRISGRPGSPYTVYGTFRGEELAGYIALKQWQDPDGYRKAHILDLHALDEAALKELIAAGETYAAECGEINLWSIKGYPYREPLERMGFAATHRQPLIARTFDGVPPKFPPGKCSLAYGDGDTLY